MVVCGLAAWGKLMRNPLVLLAISFSFSGIAQAQTSFPMITHVHPVALERGKTTEVTVEAQTNFGQAYKALFDAPGISAEIVPPPEPKKGVDPKTAPTRSIKLKITVAANAPLGMREFRVASNLGISSVGHILLVADPVVLEQANNNAREQAQVLKLPCVVAGKLEVLEDLDYFKFEAKEKEIVTFEVFCARLQDRIHDLQKHAKPMLTLFDASGRELAANDCFYFADPLLSYTIPKSGVYYLQIRESTYDGDARWVYALLATNQPHATHVYPMAGNPGQRIEAEPIGSAKSKRPKISLEAPTQPGLHQIQLDLGGSQSNPVAFYVSKLPQFLEQEPNDEPEKATRVTLPAGLNGRIGQKRDLDHFVFAAVKGKALRFELKARRFGTNLQSSLHGVLDILNPKGAVLATNDISHGQEAALVYTPPADGDYLLRVRDLNSKGGDSFVYHVEATFAAPDFTLQVDPDKAMIGPGSSAAWYVHVNRAQGFAGPVKIDVNHLPPGITASPLTIPPTMTQGLIVVSADPTAQKQAILVEVVGTAQAKAHDGKEVTLHRKAVSRQEIYNPGGGRVLFDVATQAVAVTDPSDILKVEVSTKEIVLKPGGEAKIDVTILRRPDYDKSISLDVILQHLGQNYGNPLPPGVTLDEKKSKTLLGTSSQGHIVLKCAPNAEPIDAVPISVLCHVSINFVVKVSYSSQPILVSVRKQ